MIDDMYNYYGSPLWIHDDDDCNNAMREVFEIGEIREGHPNIPLSSFLSIQEKELLEDSAPMFNTLPNGFDLQGSILELAKLLMNYRSDVANYSNANTIRSLSPTHKKKTDDERITEFRKKIVSLINMMGGFGVGTEAGNNLKEILTDAGDNPENCLMYRPDKNKLKPSTQPIKDHLKKLTRDLPKNEKATTIKNDEIENFIKKLIALEHDFSS